MSVVKKKAKLNVSPLGENPHQHLHLNFLYGELASRKLRDISMSVVCLHYVQVQM